MRDINRVREVFTRTVRRCRQGSAVPAAILVFIFIVFSAFPVHAAPHLTKAKPEPAESIGMPLRERMVQRAPGVLYAPAGYPAGVRVLFLRVEFQPDADPSASRVTGSGLWNDPVYAYNGDPDYWVNRAQTNFVSYWSEVSYGLLSATVDVSPKVYQLPHVTSYYGNETGPALENFIYDSVTAAEADPDPATKIDFSLYDALLIVHAGCGEESDVNSDSPNDLWSLSYSNTSIAPNARPDAQCSNCLKTVLKDGNPITEAIVMPQTDVQDTVTVDPLGVYVHEFGHWLGLPDLYCTAGYFCLNDGVGRWSLMGDGIYTADPASQADSSRAGTCASDRSQCIYGSSPAQLDAWSKVYLGWVVPRTPPAGIDPGYVTLNPAETSADIMKLQASSDAGTQYFLLENRQQTGYDKGLPGHGLLIWLIDDFVVNSNFASNSINNNRYRPGVKVVEADNDWKLLSYGCSGGDDCGSAGDPFPGSSNNTALSPHTQPSSTAYTPYAWVNIRNITESAQVVGADIGYAPLPPGQPGMFLNNIAWQPNTDPDVAGYKVYRNGVALGQTAETSFFDSTARNGDAYRITAVDVLGDESDFSGQVVANMAVSTGGPGGMQCFIATAAYGSYLEPHVEALRRFRDRWLLTNAPGRALVAFYYRHSPPAADFISSHDSLRAATRFALAPVVFFAEYPVPFTAVLVFICVPAIVVLRRRAANRVRGS